MEMSSTFETLEFNGLEKAHSDAKGDDDLLKDAYVDDSEVCPDIDNNNMAIPKDNHLNETFPVNQLFLPCHALDTKARAFSGGETRRCEAESRIRGSYLQSTQIHYTTMVTHHDLDPPGSGA